jgi:hypothetical protein
MTGVDALVQARRNWLGLPELMLGGGGVVDFLHAQVASGDVLLHGSNRRTIELFEPRDQTSYHGVPVRAVFATPDPVWPLFFAVTDTIRAWSRWNMCLLPEQSGAACPRYFFSVGARPSEVWCEGAVYLLPRTEFTPSDEPSEWVATGSVEPLAVVPVTAADFPFRDRVFRHEAGEPEWRQGLRLVRAAATQRLRRQGSGAARVRLFTRAGSVSKSAPILRP